MKSSLMTHGALTEPSRTYSRNDHIGKGREGKGREKEVGHPCLSSHWSDPDRPLMDGGYAAEFGGGSR